MADHIPAPGEGIPPSATSGAPGYEPSANQVAGGAGGHIPPPLSIPQNTNPIPTAISSPMNNGQNILSPQSAGGFIRRAAPEPNKRSLYVGGLDPRVTEEVLKQIFDTVGHVLTVKIIPDKNFHSKGLNYGFIDFDDPAAADRAMTTLNGRKVHGQEIRVNWAYQSNNANKEDTSGHHHVFVGDLSNEVNDEILLQAFSAFGPISEARVMWDMKTGRSRGYGFVVFRERTDADKAIASMDGEWLGSRAIRCNWANQKGQPSIAQQQTMVQMGITPTTPFNHPPFPTGGMNAYEQVLQQSPPYQTTCYVGNLTPYTLQTDIAPLFLNFGSVVEARMQSDRGFAFVKMETHEQAAMAICRLNGYMVNGRPIKCSWGKDRPATMTFDQSTGVPQPGPGGYPPYSPQQAPPNSAGYPQSAYPPQSAGSYNQFNQYGGMPSPQGQVGYGAPPGPYQQAPTTAGAYQHAPPPPPPQNGQWSHGQQGPGGYAPAPGGYGGYQG